MGVSDEHRWERRQVEAALEKISHFATECSRQAETLERRAKVWGTLHLTLGLPAAILATLAGASALAELFGRTVSGLIALSAAALSATIAFLGGADRRRDAETRANGLRTLAREAEDYVSLDALDPRQKLNAPYLFRDFNERRTAVLAGQPLPQKWWKGQPESAYDRDELSWLVE